LPRIRGTRSATDSTTLGRRLSSTASTLGSKARAGPAMTRRAVAARAIFMERSGMIAWSVRNPPRRLRWLPVWLNPHEASVNARFSGWLDRHGIGQAAAWPVEPGEVRGQKHMASSVLVSQHAAIGADGVRLNYWDYRPQASSTGEPIVLVHGL